MKQKGKIRLGNMVLDAEIEVEMHDDTLDAFNYALSGMPIHANCQCDADPLNVVEGSIVEPITDPTRLLSTSEVTV